VKELLIEETSQVAGAAYLTGDTEYRETYNVYPMESWYISPDGSLPAPLQAKIDSGASWEEVRTEMIIYQMAVEIIKANNPDYFLCAA